MSISGLCDINKGKENCGIDYVMIELIFFIGKQRAGKDSVKADESETCQQEHNQAVITVDDILKFIACFGRRRSASHISAGEAVNYSPGGSREKSGDASERQELIFDFCPVAVECEDEQCHDGKYAGKSPCGTEAVLTADSPHKTADKRAENYTRDFSALTEPVIRAHRCTSVFND